MPQWLRLCLPIQGLWVWSLVRELWFHIDSDQKQTSKPEYRNNRSSIVTNSIKAKAMYKNVMIQFLITISHCWPLSISFCSLNCPPGAATCVAQSRSVKEFPDGLMVRTLLSLPGTQVQSLEGQLRCHKPCSVPSKKERERESSSVLFLTMQLSSGIRKFFGLILPEWKRQWEFMLLYLSLKWRNGSKGRLVFGQQSALVKLALVGTVLWPNS